MEHLSYYVVFYKVYILDNNKEYILEKKKSFILKCLD